MYKQYLWLFPALLSFLLSACGGEEKEIKVQSIAISQPSAELEIGETLTLKASISPSNASYDIEWISTVPTIAAVSSSGLVSALSEGKTTVFASAGDKTASCEVTVKNSIVAVTSISLNRLSLEMFEGDTETLLATVLPIDATNKTITWNSSNTSVVKVENGVVTALAAGEASISAIAGGFISICNIIVKRPIVHFTDQVFKDYCIENFDKDADGEISFSEASVPTTIEIDKKRISSLEGIECFTNLTKLSCNMMHLTSLDVSKNTELEYLSCFSNQIESLNIDGCAALEYLDCSINTITNLDLKSCKVLTELYSGYNPLGFLDVSMCPYLEILVCFGNPLTSLDVSKCSLLKYLDCRYNQISSLDCGNCPHLEQLWCSEGTLSYLDVSNCSELLKLDCSNNNLTTLDIQSCLALELLWCHDNQLSDLNIKGFSSLKELWCQNNLLEFLDVSDCSLLEELFCFGNRLNSLDVSKTNLGNKAYYSQLFCAPMESLKTLYLRTGQEIYGINVYRSEVNIPDQTEIVYIN